MIALLVCVGLAAAAEPVQFKIDVKVLKGDPLGSRAEGTVKHLAEPALVTLSGKQARFLSGGQAPIERPDGTVAFEPFGLSAEVLPIARPDGSVWLELSTTSRAVNAGLGIAGAPGFTEQGVRVTRVVRPGETFKVRVTAGSPTDQTWIEVTVTPVGAVPRELR